MASGIEEILTTLYEMVQDAWSLPLGADKCVLERDKVLDLLDEISNQLPGELKQAKTIVESRNEVITNAKREAENILKQAEQRRRSHRHHKIDKHYDACALEVCVEGAGGAFVFKEQVSYGNYRKHGGILYVDNKVVADLGNDISKSLRENNGGHGLGVSHANGLRRLDLTGIYGKYAAANGFRHVCAGVYGNN